MDKDFFELMQNKKQEQELAVLESYNQKTKQFGLCLSQEEAKELMICRNNSLKRNKRIEFGPGMLDRLIFTFCDSMYINQENYLDTLEQLQEIFYQMKNETEDRLTDDELLTFMKEQFETVCFGDVQYLHGTCLERFATAVRAGYDGYEKSGGHGEYDQFDEEQRWDFDLFMEVYNNLF